MAREFLKADFSRSWTERRRVVRMAADVLIGMNDADVLRDIEILKVSDSAPSDVPSVMYWYERYRAYAQPIVALVCVPIVYALTCASLFVQHGQPMRQWFDTFGVVASRMTSSMWTSLVISCFIYARSAWSAWTAACAARSVVDERDRELRDASAFRRAVDALWRVLFCEDADALRAFDVRLDVANRTREDDVRLAHFVDAIQGVARGFAGFEFAVSGSDGLLMTDGLLGGTDVCAHWFAVVRDAASIRDCLELCRAFGVSNCTRSCVVPGSLSRVMHCDELSDGVPCKAMLRCVAHARNNGGVAVLGDVFRDLTDDECQAVADTIAECKVLTIVCSGRDLPSDGKPSRFERSEDDMLRRVAQRARRPDARPTNARPNLAR